MAGILKPKHFKVLPGATAPASALRLDWEASIFKVLVRGGE
jgi:hypothetical protein